MIMLTAKECKSIIKERMGNSRYTHCINVADEAVRLANKYGGDVNKAEIAGLLHDITKETPIDEQLQIIQNAGIILDEIEISAPKLYHSISGYAYLKDVLKIDDEDILNAVRYHTTARANMSLLEQIIYIADFTSAERDYDGVDKMRKAANKSMDKAMLEGLSFSIVELAEKCLPIGNNTLEAYNQFVLGKNK